MLLRKTSLTDACWHAFSRLQAPPPTGQTDLRVLLTSSRSPSKNANAARLLQVTLAVGEIVAECVPLAPELTISIHVQRPAVLPCNVALHAA